MPTFCTRVRSFLRKIHCRSGGAQYAQASLLPDQQLTDDLAEELFLNAKDFLNHGLRFLLQEKADSRSAKVVVVNLQMSLELFMKRFLVRNGGLQSIFRTDCTCCTNLRSALWSGSLRTIDYNELRKRFLARAHWSERQRKLLDVFQYTRNDLVHTFKRISHEEYIIHSAEFVFHVIRRVVESNGNPALGDYLDEANYKSLICFGPYVDHAIRKAADEAEDEITYCWACRNKTMDWSADGSCLCHVCGTCGDSEATPFVDCPACGEHSFAYDGLNIRCNPAIKGQCFHCQRDSYIALCIDCENLVFTEHGQGQMVEQSKWVCTSCYKERQTTTE